MPEPQTSVQIVSTHIILIHLADAGQVYYRCICCDVFVTKQAELSTMGATVLCN
jgi:hypothetical protein